MLLASSASPLAAVATLRTARTVPVLAAGSDALPTTPICAPDQLTLTTSPTATPAAQVDAGASVPSPVVTHTVPSLSMRVTVAGT